MTTTQLILTGIILAICVVIAYGKGYRDRRKDEEREKEVSLKKPYSRPERALRVVRDNGKKSSEWFKAFEKPKAA